jgi:hypothetical protein
MLPNALVDTGVHQAVFGPSSSSTSGKAGGGGIDGMGETVDIWRETRYLGGVAGVSEY